jgi:uncharacterized membrane protein YcaP (DUF421 family)
MSAENRSKKMILFLGELILLFIIFIISVRFLGKAAIAQLTPFDFGAIIFLAYLAFAPIEIKEPIQGIVGMFVITLLHFLISKLNLYKWFNHIIMGEPTILIKHGKLIPLNLKRTRFSLMELLSTARAAGIPDIEDIEYAILEPNGEITIIPQVDLVPVTPRLLKIDTEYNGLPIAVILEGRIQHKNLELIHKDEKWLLSELEKKGYKKIKNIVYASVRDTNHSLNIYLDK